MRVSLTLSNMILFFSAVFSHPLIARAVPSIQTPRLTLGALSNELSFDQTLRSLPSSQLTQLEMKKQGASTHPSIVNWGDYQDKLPAILSVLTHLPHDALVAYGSPKVVIRSLSPVRMTFLFTFNFGEV